MISVIVPVYNVELYLEDCCNSILRQSFIDFELILVNDGSTDGSYEIAKKIQKRDKRVILLSQNNRGQSAARNLALRASKGEYVVFVDSDDWIDSDALECLLKNIEIYQADFVCCRAQFVDIDKKRKVSKKSYDEECISSGLLQNALLVKDITTPPWAKIYKRSFLIQNNLFFQEGIVNEDTLYSIQLACLAHKVSFVNRILFNIREREGSTSRASFERLFRDMDTALMLAKDFLIVHKRFDTEIEALFYARYAKSMLYNLLQIAQRLPFSEYIRIYKICMNETSYLKYSKNVGLLSSLHYLLFYASKSPRVFFLLVKIANLFHFRMH